MKKIIATMLLFMVCLVQAQSFKHSQEEELDLDLQHWHKTYPERTKEDIEDELKTFFIRNMYEVESIDALIVRMEQLGELAVVQQIQDIHATFHDLKVKMQIPHEVELWFIQNPMIAEHDPIRKKADIKEEEAVYDGHDRRVYITANFFGRTPSSRLYSLIHELTHTQQHLRLGLRKIKEASSYDKEHEADMNAIYAIKCPICTQLVADECPSDKRRANFGYLLQKDIQNLQATKMDDDICQAHGADIEGALQLRALMPNQKKSGWFKNCFGCSTHKNHALDRLNLDWQCSQVAEDRLSTVRFEK
ncbi:MAG: hypothetical protein Q8Q60_04010 [Candidatus Chromulinivorax sp.]|nr:hypothetical protein [Candidatus Chromulinivorax sp.]